MLLTFAACLATAAPHGEPRLPHHPHDIIAAVALSPRFPADPRMFVASPGTINLFLMSTDHGLTWEPRRSGIRGEVFQQIALASDWADSGVMYVITEDGGLQISTDAGQSWQPPVCDKRLRHIAVPPVRSDGTRTLFFASANQVFASSDGGTTNHEVLAVRDARIETIAVPLAFEREPVLFVGLSDGRLMSSSDSGRTWRETKLPAGVMHAELSPDFDRDRTVWLATWGAGVMRSTDGGQSFERCVTGLSDVEVNQVRVARGTTSFELFACTREDGVFYSMDAGDTWTHTALRVQKTTQTDNHYTSLALSPSWPTDKTILCGTFEGLNISRDGGTTWRESNVNPPRIGRIVCTSPTYGTDRHLFACGYGMHLLVSPDGGDSWDLRFTGINAGSVYDICPSPDFAKLPILMLGVHRGVRHSIDAGRTWKTIQFEHYADEPKDGYTTRGINFAPGFPEDRRVFAIGTRGIFVRSEDLGLTWKNIQVVMPWASGLTLSPAFAKDSTLWVSGSGVYVSHDAGDTFSEPLMHEHVYPDGLVAAPDFASSGELYAITRYKGFMIAGEGGRHWEESNAGLEGYTPSAIVLSPDFLSDHTIHLLTSGGGLFRSTDRGRSWVRVAPLGSPIDQGFSLAVSPELAKDGTMFVGTFSGFMRSRDGGRQWESVTRTEVYDDKRDPWLRKGTWSFDYRGRPVDHTTSRSETVGDEISIEFEGVACKLLGPNGPEFGIGMLRLDDMSPAYVDQYAPALTDQQVLFESGVLKPGPHRLVLRVTGERRKEARGVHVGVDALEVVFR